MSEPYFRPGDVCTVTPGCHEFLINRKSSRYEFEHEHESPTEIVGWVHDGEVLLVLHEFDDDGILWSVVMKPDGCVGWILTGLLKRL